MARRIPMLYRPSLIRWKLDARSKMVMGKKWCDHKRQEARRVDIWDRAFGKTRKNPTVAAILYGGARPEWAETFEEMVTQMVLAGEGGLKYTEMPGDDVEVIGVGK